MKYSYKYLSSSRWNNTEHQEEILSYFSTSHFMKDDIILQADQPCDYLHYIFSGAVRSYYMQGEREVTNWLYKENAFITDWNAFIHNSFAVESFVAIDCTELLSIRKADLEYLMKKYSEMEDFDRRLMGEQLAFMKQLHIVFSLGVKARYQHLLHSFPEIFRLTKIGQVASMLDISKSTLLRLMKSKGNTLPEDLDSF